MTVPAGGTSFTYDNIFQSIRPNFIAIGFVKATATAGNYEQNPWYFKDYGVTRVGLYVDEIPVDGNPLKLNYNASSGKPSYRFLLTCLRLRGSG